MERHFGGEPAPGDNPVDLTVGAARGQQHRVPGDRVVVRVDRRSAAGHLQRAQAVRGAGAGRGGAGKYVVQHVRGVAGGEGEGEAAAGEHVRAQRR